jgi:hypothetical protein
VIGDELGIGGGVERQASLLDVLCEEFDNASDAKWKCFAEPIGRVPDERGARVPTFGDDNFLDTEVFGLLDDAPRYLFGPGSIAEKNTVVGRFVDT